ncbi:MAG: SDR family oxidoreductase [Arenicella sp.]|nr:SDR family oxidoreductase [Arenicella sp.]
MNLLNKNIVLTGASGGIGAKTALKFASENATVVLVGRNQTALNKVLSSLPPSKKAHKIVVADLATSTGRQSVIDAAGDADVLINMAGVNQLSLLEQMSDQQVSDMIWCNLTIPILLTKGFLPTLESKTEAMIINVGSILGSIGMPGSVAYCASKFGLRGFTESLHRELADTNIKIAYIAPRATATAMNGDAAMALNKELGNSVDTPEQIAQIIVDSVKNSKSSRKYIGWPEKLFVRINALFPSLVDGSLNKQLSTIKKYTK